MAIPNTVGYLITWDGTTLIDHSTLKGASICQNGATVALRMYPIPSGVLVNYDGTSDSAVTQGMVVQDIFCTTGGPALYGTLAAKLGNYGTLTLSPLTGADVTASAILLTVEDVSATPIERVTRMTIRATFQVVTVWA
jgi:hypothetical protein